MSDLICPRCKGLRYTKHHTCPPRWRVMLDPEQYGHDEIQGELIYADDAGDAAERFVHRQFDSLDYPTTADVYVRPEGGETWEPYLVEIEMVPEFHASKDRHRKAAPVQREEEPSDADLC